MSKEKKKLRGQFREEVFKRDGYKCRVCGNSKSKLDAHHITDSTKIINGGTVKENGIALCDTENGCHLKAEQYHLGKEVEKGYHPDDLYKLINSNYELAVSKSTNLG